jgi:hypothetical protein
MDKPAAAADRHRSGSVSRREQSRALLLAHAALTTSTAPVKVGIAHRSGGGGVGRLARFWGVGAGLDQDRSRLVVLVPASAGQATAMAGREMLEFPTGAVGPA